MRRTLEDRGPVRYKWGDKRFPSRFLLYRRPFGKSGCHTATGAGNVELFSKVPRRFCGMDPGLHRKRSRGGPGNQRRRALFWASRFLGMVAPSNFFFTNASAVSSLFRHRGRKPEERRVATGRRPCRRRRSSPAVQSRRLRNRGEPGGVAGPRGRQKQAHGTDPVRAVHRDDPCSPARADPALDQQVLHFRFAGNQQFRQVSRGAGVHGLRHELEEPGRKYEGRCVRGLRVRRRADSHRGGCRRYAGPTGSMRRDTASAGPLSHR